MFPYLPSLSWLPSNLTSSMPSYGHLLYYLKESFNEKVVKTLITSLLAGYQVVVLTDSKPFGVILQQTLDPFIIGPSY